jgi:hypothetical protein
MQIIQCNFLLRLKHFMVHASGAQVVVMCAPQRNTLAETNRIEQLVEIIAERISWAILDPKDARSETEEGEKEKSLRKIHRHDEGVLAWDVRGG